MKRNTAEMIKNWSPFVSLAAGIAGFVGAIALGAVLGMAMPAIVGLAFVATPAAYLTVGSRMSKLNEKAVETLKELDKKENLENGLENKEIEKSKVIEKEKTYQMGKEQELSNPYPEQNKNEEFLKMPSVPVPYDVEHGMHNNELNTKTPPSFLNLPDPKMNLKTEAPKQNQINRPSNPTPEKDIGRRNV